MRGPKRPSQVEKSGLEMLMWTPTRGVKPRQPLLWARPPAPAAALHVSRAFPPPPPTPPPSFRAVVRRFWLNAPVGRKPGPSRRWKSVDAGPFSFGQSMLVRSRDNPPGPSPGGCQALLSVLVVQRSLVRPCNRFPIGGPTLSNAPARGQRGPAKGLGRQLINVSSLRPAPPMRHIPL